MDYQYPLLKKVFDHYNQAPHDARGRFLICCQHLMEPQMRMFEYLLKFGFPIERICILGKAYSTNYEVLGKLHTKGFHVIQPKFSGISFDEEHKRNCYELLQLIHKDSQVIILDDGAELIKTFLESNRNIAFAVEQTSSGFRRLESETTSFPIFNVARSIIKLTQESPLVAHHLTDRVYNYLEEKKILNPIILIVGLGSIGESILEVFKQNKVKVEGFDIKYGHEDLLAKIHDFKPDIIIGATGNPILTKADVEMISLNRQLFLISASSSDREFPVAFFRSSGGLHDDVTYKNITFVNNGFPFTFMGNRYELTPVETEKTIYLLSGSVMHGVVNKIATSGLVEVPSELEDLIN